MATYSYTGAAQKITLEPGLYKMECWGAKGGNCPTYNVAGGYGGYVKGEYRVISETPAYLYIGKQGGDGSTVVGQGGFNGGGSGGKDAYNTTNGAGGGGATDIRLDTTLTSRIIIAGGGGGAGGWRGMTGGAGGGTDANYGGYQLGIGSAGVGNAEAGGGGGGGYYGGTGGYKISDYASGGKGGSSYISTDFKNTVITPGSNNTDGKIVITILDLYLISQNDQYYTITNGLITALQQPTTLLDKQIMFAKYGFSDLNLLLTTQADGSKLIDKLPDNFKIRIMTGTGV